MLTENHMRVSFIPTGSAVRAIGYVNDKLSVEASGANEDEAFELLRNEVRKKLVGYQLGKVVDRHIHVELIQAESEDKEAVIQVSSAHLLELAKKNPPPQAWYDENFDDL